MSVPIPLNDYAALWQSFLLRTCVRAFGDLRRNPEDRAEARIKLESFILEHGTPLLRQVERTFNVSDASLPENLLAAEWFVVFASGLDEAWIRDLDLGTLRRFWYAFEDRRLRARVVRLMATVEFVRDHLGNNAVYSEIVRLYGHGKQDTWTADLNPERREILEILFTIAKRTEPQRLGSGSLGTYVLRVIRFCMTDNNRKVADAEIQMMLGFAGELPADYRHQFDVVWRLALPRFS